MSKRASDAPTGLVDLVQRLDALQWAPTRDVRDAQFRQLRKLAEYWSTHSPSFAQRLSQADVSATDLGSAEGLARLAPLTRQALRILDYGTHVAADHGGFYEGRTSGSTGEPVVVRRTALNRLIWLALTMRDHDWHGRTLSGRMCMVRADIPAYSTRPDWGPPASILGRTGPSLSLPASARTSVLAGWISEFAPSYLLIYPSSLDALVRHCRQHRVSWPDLQQIRTVGERLRDETRAAVAETLGVSVVDCYSSSEVGYLALTCPASGQYHVMSESVVLEVTNEDGAACGPGEVGRVLVTDLHNLATPVVRYDIGDYAEVGTACHCGRGLPTLARIVGRERNLVLAPDGSRHWPSGLSGLAKVAPAIVQHQVIQLDRHRIEARLVVERALTTAEERAVADLLHGSVGPGFSVALTYSAERLEPARSGKFEEFICGVDGNAPL